MRSLASLLGIDPHSKEQRRAKALVDADDKLIKALVSLRKERGLTQAQLAEALGLKQSTISSFESHDNDPRLSTIRRYAHAVEAYVAHAVVPDEDVKETGFVVVHVQSAPAQTSPSPALIQRRAAALKHGDLALAA
jgi:transcriptional regulator with XRE-family HTH domain